MSQIVDSLNASDSLDRLIKSQPLLVQAIIKVESAGNPRAVSSAGAKGLMQLMPAICQVFKVLDPFDPIENIRGGTALIKEELGRFRDTELALAAYNAGSPAVFTAMRKAQGRTFSMIAHRLPLQTSEYVPKVTRALLYLAGQEVIWL